MTTIQREAYPFVTKVIDLFGDWLKRRREFNELMEYAADPDELGRIARELNVTSADLESLLQQESRSTNELPYMLTALDINEETLSRAGPALLRDMERVLFVLHAQASVPSGTRGGTAATSYAEYCENADTMDMLRFKS